MNWISTTGLRPWAAIPTARPPSAVSASGVSITRFRPNCSRNPKVARNTPPLTPTSSPSTTTLSSSCMARCRARLTASTRLSFFSFMALPSGCLASCDALAQHLALLSQHSRPTRVEIVENRLGRLLAGFLETLHRLLHLGLAGGDQVLLAGLVPIAARGEKGLQALDRLALPGLLDLFGWPVAGRVIGSGVIAETIAEAFHQRRSLALTGTIQGRLQACMHGQNVIAVDLFAGETGADGFLRQGWRAALDAARHRNRPLVVIDDEHHGQLPGAGNVECFEEIPLAGGAIATGGHRHPRLAAHLERAGHATGMQRLGSNGYAQRKILLGGRIDEVAAAFVAAPFQHDFLHAYPAPQLHGGVAVIGHQDVSGVHQGAEGHTNGFLAERRRVGADAPGALQGHGFLIEKAGQHHLPVKPLQQFGVFGTSRKLRTRLTVWVKITGIRNSGVVHANLQSTLWVRLRVRLLAAGQVEKACINRRANVRPVHRPLVPASACGPEHEHSARSGVRRSARWAP